MIDWPRINADLDAYGCAVVPDILAPEQCTALSNLYSKDDIFRSRVVMARHGFGRGEYKYFRYPLPPLIATLRAEFYPHLAPIANRWNEAMRIEQRFPADHTAFLAACHDAGQDKPTPLLLE